MDTCQKIAGLRKIMKQYNLNAYIIQDSDPHLSEYVVAYWKARSWLSGFHGSAGTLVVTAEESCLWTDGRYFIQAANQLKGSGVKLFKMGIPGVPTYAEWIAGNLREGQCVGFSGKVTSVSMFREMEDIFARKGIRIDTSRDLTEEIWDNRPQMPAESIFGHDIKFAGLSAKAKIASVRTEMSKEGAEYYLISSLDDIAWLFNIRGNDIPFIPVAAAYALIGADQAWLFIERGRIPGDVQRTLSENDICISEYSEVEEKLKALQAGTSVAFDSKRTNCRLYDAIPSHCKKLTISEITTKLKAVKNEVEIENWRKCHISDGIAMVKFLYWLEQNIDSSEITELTVADKLQQLRAEQPYNLGPAFATIAAYRDHGAMMHYSATKESVYVLENKGLMVLDCGGQYLGGTTDITRTIVFDAVSREEKHDFTMVLKSHIALASARFLYGASGSNLDALARKPLWDIGLDYKCGTGHGVGYCLSVHEGPHRISMGGDGIRLENNMVVTIEPGIYREGKYGIRTENMVIITEDETTEGGKFMRFKTMTLCPISLKGVLPGMLTEQEKNWLNAYHDSVFKTLSPYLGDKEREWLKENTRRI